MGSKFYFLILTLFLSAADSHACTLWAYCKKTPDGTETYIGKVRDSVPNHTEEVRLIETPNSFSYHGIFAVGESIEFTYNPLKGGTNEKGLTVIYSTAGTIPMDLRYKAENNRDLIHTILSQYSSIDDVLKNTKLFIGPKIILLADQNEIAKIEVGLGGEVSIQRKNNGFLIATNHYSELLNQNLLTIDPGSQKRFKDVHDILNKSFDHETNSKIINAVNRKTGRVISLSTWTSHMSQNGKPSVEYKSLIHSNFSYCANLFTITGPGRR